MVLLVAGTLLGGGVGFWVQVLLPSLSPLALLRLRTQDKVERWENKVRPSAPRLSLTGSVQKRLAAWEEQQREARVSQATGGNQQS